MAVCAFVVNLGLFFNQTWHEASLAPLWGVAGRSESFKSVIAGGNHTAQGMSYRVVSVSASPNSLMKLIKEDSLYSGSLAIRFFLAAFIKPATYCPNSVCLHLGQYRGKFMSIVSPLIFKRVLLRHTGHNTH